MRAMFKAVVPAMALLAASSPSLAQFSQAPGAKFLSAIKEENNKEVLEALSATGPTVVNTRDFSSRETALHLVAKKGNLLYLRFLLQKGADPNLRDKAGNTPLMVAVSNGFGDLIGPLVTAHANVNQGNDSGETPLIRAVQRRDTGMIRELIAAGADPDQADSLAGKSARVYAKEDVRTPGLAKLFVEVEKRDRRSVSGPRL